MAHAASEWIFWACVATVAYVYIGYPLSLRLLPARRPRERSPFVLLPRVSLLIAAYNEKDVIRETIRNKLDLDYPHDRLEIIVVSDGSTDGTDDIVRSFADRGVQLIRQDPRQGKTAGLNLARDRATGDIVVFSDANSRYESAAVRRLVETFEDPEVGYVTGTLVYLNPGDSASAASCGAYMRYENWLRRLETRVGSIVGVNGGIDAVRRSLYAPMRADQLPDFILPLRVVEQGFRVVYRPEAVSCEEALDSARDEFRMRVRVSLRSLRSLVEMKSVLWRPTHRLFAFQLLVHKVLRYLLFVPLGLALAANVAAALLAEPWYRVVLAAHLVFYLASVLGIFGLGAFFVVTNAASAVAFVKLLRGEHQARWEPRKGA